MYNKSVGTVQMPNPVEWSKYPTKDAREIFHIACSRMLCKIRNIPDNLISCRVVLYFLIGEKMSITDLVIGCPGNNGGNIEVGLYFLTVHFSMRLYVGERKHSVTKL